MDSSSSTNSTNSLGRRATLAAGALVLLGLLVRLYNSQVFPALWGADGYGHTSYIDLILDKGTLPDPADSWQAYHPPGYYFLSAMAAKTMGWLELPKRYRAGQLLSTLAGSLTLLACFVASRKILPSYSLLPPLFLAVLPAAVMASAMAYNVSLAMALTATFLALLLRYWDESPCWTSEISLALVLGAAVLVRTDATVLGVLLVWRSVRLALKTPPEGRSKIYWNSEVAAGFLLSIALLTGISGWFFTRNLAEHGHLLVSNLDPDMYPYDSTSTLGLPNFFRLRFMLDSGSTVWLNPVQPEGMSSLPATLYVSLWTDHNKIWRSKESLSQLRLIAGLLPSVLVLIGIWSVKDEPSWHPVFGVMAANMAACAWLITKIPTYTGYKAIYLYPSFTAWALLFGAGIRQLNTRPRLQAASISLCFVSSAFLLYSLIWVGG